MKECKEGNCSYPVFGGGYCSQHQYLRRKENKNRIPKDNIHHNKIDKVDYDIYQWGFKTQPELFNHVWYSRAHCCEVSGESLEKYVGTDFFVNMFAHILSKSNTKYPLFKYNPANILLVSPDIHHLLDHGSEDQRVNHLPKEQWKVFWDRRRKLISQYKRI